MPLIFDRRSFLKHAAIASAVFPSFALRAKDQTGTRWALLSDTHIAADPNDNFRGFYPHKNLKKVVEQVVSQDLDMFIVNGDLARLKGEPEDYAAFTPLIQPLTDKFPMVATLGNHDDRKNARGALTKRLGDVQPVEQKLVSVIDSGPVHVVMLDSLLVTNIGAGQLGKSQREWLNTYLNTQTAKPIVVFVHHNPDADWDYGLVDAERLLAIIKPHHAVKALIYGHTHVYAFDKQDGLHLINIPAVGYNFADGNPVGWVQAVFSGDGADLKLHAIEGDVSGDGKTTSLAWRSL